MSDKKKNIILLVLLGITFITLTAGVIKVNQREELKESDFKKLVNCEYEVKKLNINNGEIKLTVYGDLSKSDIEKINKQACKLIKNYNNKNRNFIIDVVDKDVEGSNEFYYDGLKFRSNTDVVNGEKFLGEYRKISEEEVEKIKSYENMLTFPTDKDSEIEISIVSGNNEYKYYSKNKDILCITEKS